MESGDTRKRCVCCGNIIVGRRTDAEYCKSCRKHKEDLYAKWRTDEKRDINQLLKEVGKNKELGETFREVLKEHRQKEIRNQRLKDMQEGKSTIGYYSFLAE